NVNSEGLIRAVSTGNVTIQVETMEGGFKDTCFIEVIKHVEGVEIENCIDTLFWNEEYDLNAIVTPLDASDKSVLWYSSDSTIATVSNEGVIFGLSPGEATITIETRDDGFTDICKIIIVKYVTGVDIENCIDTLIIPDTYEMSAIVSPLNATEGSINWFSSDDGIASIDSEGLISAISAGEVTITVETEEGGFTDECEIGFVFPLGINHGREAMSAIYPNPADNFIVLNTILPDVNWSLYSIHGKQISKGTNKRINVQGLESGVYLLYFDENVHKVSVVTD
nr:Ig-like domain-containing protein [Bacteroidales bacterium]